MTPAGYIPSRTHGVGEDLLEKNYPTRVGRSSVCGKRHDRYKVSKITSMKVPQLRYRLLGARAPGSTKSSISGMLFARAGVVGTIERW